MILRRGRRTDGPRAVTPPPAAPWPDMPPRPQLQEPASPFPPRGAMNGIVDPEFDPCGAGPIKNGKAS